MSSYNNYEGFEFKGLDGPFQEFPMVSDGVYDGGEYMFPPRWTGLFIALTCPGSPGADRVVITEDGCLLAGSITHTGADGNNFVACEGTS